MSGDGAVLAIDCGTQSLRAFVIDGLGRVLAARRVEYRPYYSDRPAWAEQDPELWWRALAEACSRLKAEERAAFEAVRAVTVTAQRDSMVCLDGNADPLRPAILWLDARKAPRPYRPSWPMALALKAIGMDEALARTQEAGKCNWIRRYEPETWGRTRAYVQVSGFLNARLTGEFADSVASQIGHVPFDYRRQRWAAPGHRNARMFPVEPDKLPRLVPSGAVLGAVTRRAAFATGLPEGLPVAAAGSDKGCETVGMGALDGRAASLSFGTTATVQTMSPRYAEALRFMPAFPAVLPGAFNPEIEIFRGYWMITWFKNQFAYEEVRSALERGVAPEEALNELLEATPPGCRGLVMQPYWTAGLKTPSAKGAVIGFGDAHERAHLYRAIIEGLAYGLREGLSRIERATGVRAELLTVSGGASRSDQICQISADVLGLPLARGATPEASGLGAAVCAAAALGWYPGVRAAAAAMNARAGGAGRVFEPDPERGALYDELYTRVYKKMYAALAPLYEAIRDITGYPEKPE